MPLRARLARWSDDLLIDRHPRLGARLFDLVGANREPEMALLPRLCRRDRVSIDVGAKIGAYARRMLPLSAHVHAFEPNPRAARFLARTNCLRTTVHQLALGAGSGNAELRIPHDATGRSLAGRATIAPANTLGGLGTTSLPVRCDSLDRLAAAGILGSVPVGFIKIDVEGHERAVIAGAAALLRRDRPVLLIEANAAHGGDVPGLIVDLAAFDYRRFALIGNDLRRLPAVEPSPSENIVFIPA